MSIKTYRDVLCDGCQAGWTLSVVEDPETYFQRDGWVTKGACHYCPDCQAKGKAAEQMELAAAEGA